VKKITLAFVVAALCSFSLAQDHQPAVIRSFGLARNLEGTTIREHSEKAALMAQQANPVQLSPTWVFAYPRLGDLRLTKCADLATNVFLFRTTRYDTNLLHVKRRLLSTLSFSANPAHNQAAARIVRRIDR
jgi:hypothetical protein